MHGAVRHLTRRRAQWVQIAQAGIARAAQGHRAVQQVLQLAHVAGQRRLHDGGQLLGRQLDRRHAGLVRDARQQHLAQRGDVLAPLAQRRMTISITFRR
jgi:hypothetical protein